MILVGVFLSGDAPRRWQHPRNLLETCVADCPTRPAWPLTSELLVRSLRISVGDEPQDVEPFEQPLRGLLANCSEASSREDGKDALMAGILGENDHHAAPGRQVRAAASCELAHGLEVGTCVKRRFER